MGRRGAAEGFSNLAIRSRSEPDTTRDLGSPAPGEDERDRLAGGVRLGGVGLLISTLGNKSTAGLTFYNKIEGRMEGCEGRWAV